MPNIYILSGPVQSGKTSRLQTWAAGHKNVRGILAPVIDGKRYLQDISNAERRLLEIDGNGNESDVLRIGKYVFLEKTFSWARNVLTASLHHPAKWIVIDEIGPLELQGKGLEPAVRTILRNVSNKVNVLWVVRQKLLTEVLQHYGLSEKSIVHFTFE